MTGSGRPSPEPLLKKEAPRAVLGGENSGNALEASNALNYRVWGIPAVLSTGIPGNALRAFPEFFRNFFREAPAVLGVWPTRKPFSYQGVSTRGVRHSPDALRQTSIMCKWTRPFRGQTAGGHPKAFRQPLFAVPAVRELEPTVCLSGLFQGLPGGGGGGQQQFATQTLGVHLLGIEKKARTTPKGCHETEITETHPPKLPKTY